MRKTIIILALVMPLGLMAVEVTDTTIVYNGKQFFISDDPVETRISVYTQDSNQLTKASETKFVNNQEVERIYVSSPILPTNSSLSYSSMHPTIWLGSKSLSTNIGNKESTTSKEGIHARGGFEIGITTAEGILPINKRGNFLFSTAIQMVYNKHSFQNSALLANDGHHIAFEDHTNAPASANYMSYASMRVPFMLGYSPTVNWSTDWLDTQFGIGIVPEYRFGKARYMFEPEAFGNPVERKLNLYHWGMNVDFNMVLGPVKFCASIDLLPLFKTTDGKKAYCSSLNFGINIGELFGKRSQNGSF